MSRPSIVTVEALVPLLNAGKTTQEIAEALGVQSPAVTKACRKFGFATAGKGRPRGAPQAAMPIVKAQPKAIDSREAQLRATGGRYADLRAWAQRWGTTETKARQEWHKPRLPVGKGCVS